MTDVRNHKPRRYLGVLFYCSQRWVRYPDSMKNIFRGLGAILTLTALLHSAFAWADYDFGVGTSSVTSGRPVPAVAFGYDNDSWGLVYRSTGVQTPIYAQNAWMGAWDLRWSKEQMWFFDATIGAGAGAAYVLGSYRESLTASTEFKSDVIVGPHLYLKLKVGPVYLGFDTILGITSKVQQHLVLNFQDVSHFTIGVSL